jgi:hypothetical protein
MTCERYWREGIVLVERGLVDPHRDGCPDCMRAHASRQELVEALPLIGASDTGDPHWQGNVWRRIDEERAPSPWRWRWQLAGALTVACVVALWIGLGRTHPDEVRPHPDEARPRIEIIAEAGPMRSRSTANPTSISANVDDRLRVTVGEDSDVWIYRAGSLVWQCRAGHASDGCAPNSDGMVVEKVLSISGLYQVITVKAPPVALPHGGLDDDRAALESARIFYFEDKVSVH